MKEVGEVGNIFGEALELLSLIVACYWTFLLIKSPISILSCLS